jgi:outer membrane protein assembly factor BamE (lipoprotein component of BamABCDE complex)
MYKIRLIKKGDQNQSNIHLIKQKQLNLYFKNLGIKKEKLNEIFSNKSNKTPNKKINISKFFLSFKEKAT